MRISRRLIVEGAVGFDVADMRATKIGNFLKRPQLAIDESGNFAGAELLLHAAHVFAIFVTRMRTNGDFRAKGLFDGLLHRLRSPGVSAAGNVGGANETKQRLLAAVSH